MLHVTTFFLLAGGSSAEVPVEIEEVAQLATLVDGFGSLGFRHRRNQPPLSSGVPSTGCLMLLFSPPTIQLYSLSE